MILFTTFFFSKVFLRDTLDSLRGLKQDPEGNFIRPERNFIVSAFLEGCNCQKCTFGMLSCEIVRRRWSFVIKYVIIVSILIILILSVIIFSHNQYIVIMIILIVAIIILIRAPCAHNCAVRAKLRLKTDSDVYVNT